MPPITWASFDGELFEGGADNDAQFALFRLSSFRFEEQLVGPKAMTKQRYARQMLVPLTWLRREAYLYIKVKEVAAERTRS